MRSLDRVDWQWYLICFLNVCFLLFWWICRGFWMDANRDSRTCPQILCSQNTYIQWEAAPYSASHWNVRNLESSNTKSPEDISFLEERPIEWSEGIACYLTWELGISLLLLPELAEGQSQHAIENTAVHYVVYSPQFEVWSCKFPKISSLLVLHNISHDLSFHIRPQIIESKGSRPLSHI